VARRLPLSGVCALAVAIVALIPRVASAAPNDAAAQRLRKDAIHTDFLATNFAEAGNKLKKAVALCQGPADCTPAVRALVLCDLGVIEFTLQHPDAARADFAAAQKEDPTVMLDKDLSSPGLEKEFEAARALVGAAPVVAKPAAPPTGDMAHIAVTTQSFLTPIPIYIELPAGVAVEKVIVRYKGPTAADWKTATMTKLGTGYGVELPCQDVGTAVGTLKYYVQGQDAAGDLVSSSGRLSDPYSVAIVEHAEGEAAHLPGKPAPAVCLDVADCPPSFPGCHSGGKEEPTKCESDTDCTDGATCAAGICAAKPPEDAPYKRNWVSLSFQQDMLFVPSATDACAGGTGYTCFNSGTSTYYPQTPLKGADDVVAGGIKFATSRILAGYDRAFLPNLTLGTRLGFAFGGGPQRPGGNSFVPVHFELRAAYWFGHNPLARKGFRFYVVAAGGIAEVDALVAVDAYANVAAYKANNSVNYDAWTKTGTGFISAGGGAMYAITPWTGILLEVKVAEEFPTTGTGLNGTISYVLGF
jgi:hypothetical protein